MRIMRIKAIAFWTALFVVFSCAGMTAWAAGADATAPEPQPTEIVLSETVTPQIAETAAPTPEPEPAEDPTEEPAAELPAFCKATLIVNGQITEVLVAKGQKLVRPDTPHLDGHTFAHWFDAKDTVHKAKFDFDREINEDIQLVALFVRDAGGEEQEEDASGEADDGAGEEGAGEEGAVDLSGIQPGSDPIIVNDLEIVIVVNAEDGGEPVPAEPTETPEGTVEVEDSEPDDEPGETIVPDETVPLAGPAVERKVVISCVTGGQVKEGAQITLFGVLSGFENCKYALQWQYNAGNGWVDVKGATELKHTFTLTMENFRYNWRLAVTILSENAK